MSFAVPLHGAVAPCEQGRHIAAVRGAGEEANLPGLAAMRRGKTLHTRRFNTAVCILLAMCLPAALSSCGVRGKHMSIETYRLPDDPGVIAATANPVGISNAELDYLIGVRDVIEVDVADHIEFGGNFRVEADGTFEVPTIYRRVRVSGLTTGQAEARIRDVLDDMVVGRSQVHVKVLISRSRRYFMLGAVGRKGKYFMGLQDITVREALMRANIWGPGAKKDRVYIITPDERDRPSYVTVNGDAILMGSLRDDVVLKPGDIVYVPTTLYFKINKVIDEIIGQADRAQDIESDLQYGRRVGRDGYGNLEDATTP